MAVEIKNTKSATELAGHIKRNNEIIFNAGSQTGAKKSDYKFNDVMVTIPGSNLQVRIPPQETHTFDVESNSIIGHALNNVKKELGLDNNSGSMNYYYFTLSIDPDTEQFVLTPTLDGIEFKVGDEVDVEFIVEESIIFNGTAEILNKDFYFLNDDRATQFIKLNQGNIIVMCVVIFDEDDNNRIGSVIFYNNEYYIADWDNGKIKISRSSSGLYFEIGFHFSSLSTGNVVADTDILSSHNITVKDSAPFEFIVSDSEIEILNYTTDGTWTYTISTGEPCFKVTDWGTDENNNDVDLYIVLTDKEFKLGIKINN